MKITPLDIRQQRFTQKWRGVDPDEVKDFLHMVAEEVEEVVRESMFLEEELGKKTQQLQAFRDREDIIKGAMLTAQKVTEDMKETVKREGEVILSEARLQSEKIVAQAHERIAELRREIHELKQQRLEAGSELRHILTTHLRRLDLAEAADAEVADGDDTLKYLRRECASGDRKAWV